MVDHNQNQPNKHENPNHSIWGEMTQLLKCKHEIGNASIRIANNATIIETLNLSIQTCKNLKACKQCLRTFLLHIVNILDEKDASLYYTHCFKLVTGTLELGTIEKEETGRVLQNISRSQIISRISADLYHL